MSDLKRLAPEEVAALYSLHGEELRQFLRALSRDDAVAADALQTVFSRLLERGSEVAEDRRRSWLFQVAYREAMLLRRKAKVRRNAHDRLAEESANQRPVDGPERRIDQGEQVARLRRAVDALPPEQREAFVLKIYEERTFREIAERLGIPIGTAITRVRAATTRLRRELGDE